MGVNPQGRTPRGKPCIIFYGKLKFLLVGRQVHVLQEGINTN